jgi:dethiobiotin synthetase
MNTDAHLLAAASGEDPASVCDPRRWYSAPLAPPIAAASLDQAQFSVADLADELEWPPGIELQVLEGAGGIRSPLAADGDLVDLMWRLPVALVILVSDAGLGAINAVRLAAAATDPFPTIVFLNRFDAENSVHLHNLRWLRENDRLTVMTEAVDLAEFLVDRSDRS